MCRVWKLHQHFLDFDDRWAQELVAARHSLLEDLVDVQTFLPECFRQLVQEVVRREPNKSQIYLSYVY